MSTVSIYSRNIRRIEEGKEHDQRQEMDFYTKYDKI